MNLILVIFSLPFLFLAWKNFRWAIFLFVGLLPTYLIRFELFQIGKYPFPSTLLEITFGLLFLVWLVKYSRQDWQEITGTVKRHKLFFLAVAVFFVSSVISIFVSDMAFFSLGEWRAYFLEPMILFLIILGRKKTFKTNDLIWVLAVSTLSISIFSVVQKFTGWGIATPEWANEATRRVTAFYTSPNAVGLYLAPILMLMFSVIAKPIKSAEAIPQKKGVLNFLGLLRHPATAGLLAMTILTVLALTFTKSQGAWIAVGAGVLVLLFFIGYKKITIGLAIAGIIFSLIVPSVQEGVLFKDPAGKNRLRLWGYSWTFLKQNPKNFMLGTGVRQFFRKIQKPYYDTKVMERLIYPHNIFLNFWTEIGLFGMLAIVFVLGYATYLSNKVRQNNRIIGAGLLAMITALVVHGLVDVPYFKNDLAFLFWILIATVFVAYVNIYQSQADGLRK